MDICKEIISLPTSSPIRHECEEKERSYDFTSPFSKHVRDFTQGVLERLFPKKKSISPLPLLNDPEDPSIPTELCSVLDFDKLVETVSLKIWGMLRAHLQQINRYHEEQEKFYRDAIKTQVKSYLSWVGTALQVGSIATGICSISFMLFPGPTIELCKNTLHFLDRFNVEWYHSIIQQGTFSADNVKKSLELIQGVFNSSSNIHNNYTGADRTSAQGAAEINKIHMESTSRRKEETRNELSSLIQTIQQTHQQESDARKAISR